MVSFGSLKSPQQVGKAAGYLELPKKLMAGMRRTQVHSIISGRPERDYSGAASAVSWLLLNFGFCFLTNASVWPHSTS